MNAPAQAGLPALPLKDPKLFREQCYVDGAWLSAAGGRSFPVANPATGAVIANVPDLGAAEARRAIEAAHAAWAGWRIGCCIWRRRPMKAGLIHAAWP